MFGASPAPTVADYQVYRGFSVISAFKRIAKIARLIKLNNLLLNMPRHYARKSYARSSMKRSYAPRRRTVRKPYGDRYGNDAFVKCENAMGTEPG